ncbi:hypothetical protein [Pseudoalteromonas rubra]|uniref:Uncharacterized protein n=1 Tax=Pseudoalteromonas rubra TaxID=43658 RepID=A0A4V2E3P8_9GAMM|nr:hypothetical protein [Pseudoalteromonas rubra]RZM83190.1 hypothetical protein C3B51_07725 [Pseudoalteromonas rubra]
MQSRYWVLVLCLMVSLTVNASGGNVSVHTAQLSQFLIDNDDDDNGKLDSDPVIVLYSVHDEATALPLCLRTEACTHYPSLTYYQQGIRAPPALS